MSAAGGGDEVVHTLVVAKHLRHGYSSLWCLCAIGKCELEEGRKFKQEKNVERVRVGS